MTINGRARASTRNDTAADRPPLDTTAGLPPGQRARPDFPRYGLPSFAGRWPTPAPRPALKIIGDVAVPLEIAISELTSLPRREQRSDLHCVATWSRLGIRWSGYRFGDVYRELIAPRTKPSPEVQHLWLQGADGYSASLLLEDALADDVLLADGLEGEALSLEHGAPLRLVAPAHYGYKSVRHLRTIGLYRRFRPGFGGPLVHPRARVALEERSLYLPGPFYRHLYRALLPLTLWIHQRLGRRARSRPPSASSRSMTT
jgi:DMSO/TMAO reductase YedYZ molybdopterin-dependent catalytic subunit